MADDNLFDVFNLPFVRGNPRTALRDAHSVTLSESEARRRFGNADPIGKPLTIVDNSGDVRLPHHRRLQGHPEEQQYLSRHDRAVRSRRAIRRSARLLTAGAASRAGSIVKLRPGTDAEDDQRAVAGLGEAQHPRRVTNGERHNAGDDQELRLTNLRDVHLGKAQDVAMTPGNDRGTITTFASSRC